MQGLHITVADPATLFVIHGAHLHDVKNGGLSIPKNKQVYIYLRVHYARIGHRRRPACGAGLLPVRDAEGGEPSDDDPRHDAACSYP